MATKEQLDLAMEFHGRIAELVNEAVAAGVEVEGSWPILVDDPEVPSWDLEIVSMV